MAMAPDKKLSANAPPSFDEALRAYQEIESFLEVDEETVRLPLKVLTSALPAGSIKGPVPAEIADTPVPITITDLFFKLSKGKVSVAASEIIDALPSQLLAGGIPPDPTMEVKLPLSAIVAAVDPKVMQAKMAAKTHKANLSNLPDPFSSLKGALDSYSRKDSAAQSAPLPPPSVPPKPTPTQQVAAQQTPIPPSAIPTRPVAPTVPPATTVPPVITAPMPAPAVPPTFTAPAPTRIVPPPAAVPPPPPVAAPTSVVPPPVAPPAAAVPPEPLAPPTPVPEPPVPIAPPPAPATTVQAVPEAPAPAPAPSAQIAPEPIQQPALKEERDGEQEPAAAPAQAPKPRIPAREKVVLPAEQELDYLEPESLGGVNVNSANEEQLLTLSGVTPLLAKAIIEHREKNGPFRSVFELASVPRLGRATFRKMTGMPFSDNHIHRRRKLATLLGIPASKVGDLPEVAAAIIRVPGLAGCVISDRDGLLLAESGSSGFAAAMSAVVPKMFRQMYECMAVVDVGSVDSVSFCIRERMFTIISNDNLSLTVVHETNKLTKAQVVMVQKVADELTWILSHRAYVGKTI